MITITQPQINAICWAAERHMRSLRRSGDDHEEEIKEIRGWIEALKNEKCQLSFLHLANLLKMYPTKELDIKCIRNCNNTEIESMIKLVAQQTKTLDRIVLNVNNARFTNDFSELDKLVNLLSVFDRIKHFTFEFYSASTEVLELIASLPINSLRFCTYCTQSPLSGFIRRNKMIENLEIVAPSHHLLPKEILEALKENRTLKVSQFSHSEATLSHILVIKDRHTL